MTERPPKAPRQWNSTIPARTSRLPRRTKPVARTRRSRFPKRREREYVAWIRTLPCIIESHQCSGPVECDHVKTRGAGGDDIGNCVPLCRHHHNQRHCNGLRTFERAWRVDLAELARKFTELYEAEA